MILFTLLFSLWVVLRCSHEIFTMAFVDGCLMIWFPAPSLTLSHRAFLSLYYCCYCFLSLSRSRHDYKFSFIVDFRQIEFDRIIETITIIITKNWTFSFALFFAFDKPYGFTYGYLYYLCIGKHAIRINNCIQSRSSYIQLVSHTNRSMQ